MVIVPPATGHVNPISGLVSELCKSTNNLDVIFYSDKSYQAAIERTGAQFRLLAHPSFSILPKLPMEQAHYFIGANLDCQISFSYKLIPQLLHEIETERFDLVLYDGAFLPIRYTLEILKRRYRRRRSARPPPKSILFAPNFPVTKTLVDESRAQTRMSLGSVLLLLWVFIRQIVMSIRWRMRIFNPINFFMRKDKLNIVAVIHELMPFPHELDETFKCVGPCVCEQTRSGEVSSDDHELNSLLGEFEVWAPGKRPLDEPKKPKLIYMSLGTVFNYNSILFELTIRAFRDYNLKSHRREDASRFRVIISTGDDGYKQLREKIETGELVVPGNVFLRARVPQLEVLKRASLFITHCGMNSTSEAIKYAVPIVAIPLEADQPMVAKRVCDRLMFGVRLDPIGVSSDDIADAVDQVLSDEQYANNIGEMSKISAKYNGSVEGARLVVEYLNQQQDGRKKSK